MTTTRRPRRWAVWSAACALGVTGLLLSGATAAQSQTPAQACTAAHPSVGDVPEYTEYVEGGWPLSVPGDPGGQVHLFYESDQGYNCVMVVSNGGDTYLDVGIRTADGRKDSKIVQSGSTTPPLLIEAQGVCVQVTAAVGERSELFPSGNCGE